MSSKKCIRYIYDLPFPPRRELCRILDADGRWEELGGTYMGYDVTTLTLIGQSVAAGKSPCWELLNKYSEENGKITRLFLYLNKMKHQRAMLVLKPYVEPKYHCYLRGESTMSTTQLSCCTKDDLPRPSVSQLTMCSQTRSSYQGTVHQRSSVAAQHSNEAARAYKHKEMPSSASKLANNVVNLNKELSSVSLHSKLNSLNVPQDHTNGITPKKASPMCNPKKQSNNYKEESLSDNCLSEKMKDNKKPLKQRILENDKQQKPSSRFACGITLNSSDDCLPDIMRIPYEDIQIATNGFSKDRILGRGGFGTVYRGEWKGTSVAIKRLTPRQSSDDPSQQLVSLKQSLNELNVLKCCRFDHILPLYAVSLDGENPCLVYQLMVNGSLEDRLLLKNNTLPLNWSQRSHIAQCVTKGLNYLHTTPEKPLVHGDIKSANILLDANMEAKIGDFGLTREGPGCEDTHVKVSSVHGTECYLPPEYLRQKHLSPQVDIYSYGIVLLEIATGLRPFDVKRGKGKRLTDHVRMAVDAGLCETLRDPKAGEEKTTWYSELIHIGQICSSDEKKKRPPMSQVLIQFEKINQEISMMDRIRRLSSDKGSSPLPTNLSPFEIQLYYDFQKSSQSGMLPHNRLSVSPGRSQEPSLTNGVASGHDPIRNQVLSASPRPEEINGYARVLCNSTNGDPNEAQFENPQPEASEGSSNEKSSSEGKVPIPLLTVLQLQVSNIGDTSEHFSSHTDHSISDSQDFLSDD